ncbi:succinate dehydrogenase/fumarate reductase iron-sulfur subunit [Ectothiorhodospira sp. BSL-9]|uniref:succinate dehydrogenase/fumarate reductase iron-sulfur subunit n=1 Tax=Ectothiorhodospira sp. BSL-9 TaxID=1442136 RepID=UPI0007B43006|nr:succinate dehydrogenase/fumarate reductase iron-sulfur subunit [Ectothiorhodospira sp. BSL-9]ANB03033.1 fumarate reductase [Ectothiorhodospira sp. BSL-9]TVQ74978.1 MAG: succinate dehydrogenase/fumarate reductase iron-sulfur subunit [Chromatiaceae bacterium]
MTQTRTIVIECLRFHPETDEAPYYQSYEVPFTAEMSVLEGLQYIKDHLDGTLTFRWSCRMAICGSCGCMVNNEPVLSCQTFLRDYHPARIRVEPLAHFPILRDLAIDQTDFLAKLESVHPYLIPSADDDPGDQPRNQTPDQIQDYLGYAQCINCLLCYAACPQYGLNEAFTGPAALALLHRYNADSRDAGEAQRMEVINAEEGVWGCTLVGECSEVCPKHVDPARAINQNKIASTQDYFLRFLKPRGRR